MESRRGRSCYHVAMGLCGQCSLCPMLGRSRASSLVAIRALCGWGAGWEGRVAWRWAGPAEAGMTPGCLAAPLDRMETQACTRQQNRICTCRPGWYCTLKSQEGCRLCIPLSKCYPGSGVAKPGMGLGQQALGTPSGLSFMGISSSAQPKNIVSDGQVPATHVSTHPPFILSSSTPD